MGDLQNGKPNGDGTVVTIAPRSVVYQGSFKDGSYDGKGKLYQNGYLYEDGVFSNGLIREGVRYEAKGYVYSGFFHNDVYEGQGRIVLPSGFFIRGVFSHGYPIESANDPFEASFPSAKQLSPICFSDERQNALFMDDCIALAQSHTQWYIFYFNGDVFIGDVNEGVLANGIMYKYNKTSFLPMVIGSGKVQNKYKKLAMKVEGNYKSFSLSWSVCDKETKHTHDPDF